MKEVKIKDLRQFGIVLGCILGVIGGVHFLKGHANIYPWFLGFGAAALLTGVLIPRLLRPLFIVFTKMAHAIGWFNTRVILAMVYYFLLSPIGIIMKLFRRDPLARKVESNAESYWIKRVEETATKEGLERQF